MNTFLKGLLARLSDRALAESIVGDLEEQRQALADRSRVAAWARTWATALTVVAYIGGRQLMSVLRGFRIIGTSGELRQGLRALRRTPWYTATVVGAIALTMSLATTVFAIVDGVLFKPLPYPDADEIYAVSGVFEDTAPPARLVRTASPRERHAWADHAPGVPLTLLGYSSVAFDDGEIVGAASIDRVFFDVFRVRLQLGGFTEAHFDPNAPIRPLIISHGLWQRKFGGDPSVVGRIIPPNIKSLGTATQIVGVLDTEGFVPPLPSTSANWARHTTRIDVLFPNTLSREFGERIGTLFTRVPFGRLAEVDAVLDHAVAGSRATTARRRELLTPEQRAAFAPFDGVELVALERLVTARERPVLTIAFATAAGLLVLVVLNAAAMATAQVLRRRRELAVRRSLGARGSDLFRQALFEHAVLAAAGAAIGLAGAYWLVDVVARRVPTGLNLIKDPGVDWRVALFAVTVLAATSLIIAALAVRSALHVARLSSVLAAESDRIAGRGRLGQWLVAGQVGVGFTLLLGGVLFLTSLGLVYREEPGLRHRDAAILRVSLGDFVAAARLLEAGDAIRAVPGVVAAGSFSGGSMFMNAVAPESPTPIRLPGAPATALPPPAFRVGPGFFEAAGIRILAGRVPTDAELASAAPVVAVSEALARSLWSGRGAVGETLLEGRRLLTVVGVVGDVRFSALDVEPVGVVYAPMRTSTTAGGYFFVALAGDPANTLDAVGRAVSRAVPGALVAEMRLVEDAITRSIQPRRISALAASAFGISAMALVAIGLFGLVAHASGWRTREFGIRFALGATPRGVLRLLLGEQLVAVLGGLAAGGLFAAWAVRFVSPYLYGLGTYDVRVWLAAAGILLATSLIGALIPALRASRVDPVRALRLE